jgi:hypothetical protein
MLSGIRSVARLLGVALLLLFPGLVAPRVEAARTGPLVFFERFPPDNPEQWIDLKLPDGSRAYIADGAYHLVRPHPGDVRGWPLHVKVPAGFRLNVRVVITQGADAYAGITFWDDMANNFVLFAIRPDGSVGLFRHTPSGYDKKALVDWRIVPAVHTGVGALNALAVNLDPVSAATGHTFVINGVSLGHGCNDMWHTALAGAAQAGAGGAHIGVMAGAYSGSAQVNVLRASMYDDTNLGPVPACKL